MYCYKCGEDNPDEAKFCKNCGAALKEEEKPIKAEVIETTGSTHQKTAPASSSSSNDNTWIACCCIGLLAIFVLSALFSGV